MSTPDPITTLVRGAAALQFAKQAQDFIAAATGHPDESIGTILGTLLHRRLKNAEAVMAKSHLILLDLGVQPSEVPLNIFQPVLEGASLQEDEDLQNTWANLAANAADARRTTRVEPSFVAMLRNLSSREVRFLDSLCEGVAGFGASSLANATPAYYTTARHMSTT